MKNLQNVSKPLRSIALSAFAFFSYGTANATVVQWDATSGGNGHFYEAVAGDGTLSWQTAYDAAVARGGHLVTISSSAENLFVFSLVDSSAFWLPHPNANSMGPWLGGFQAAGGSEPAGGWQWVNGEGAISDGFSNWWPGEPNNWTGDSSNESALQFFAPDNQRTALWNDISPDSSLVNSYLVEWEQAPTEVPEPATLALFACGLAVVMSSRRIRKS